MASDALLRVRLLLRFGDLQLASLILHGLAIWYMSMGITAREKLLEVTALPSILDQANSQAAGPTRAASLSPCCRR